MAEEIPNTKLRDTDFASLVLIQTLTTYQELIPVSVESKTMVVEFKLNGLEVPFQEFMDRLEKNYKDRFQEEVDKASRQLWEEKYAEAYDALNDTIRAAEKMVRSKFPEIEEEDPYR